MTVMWHTSLVASSIVRFGSTISCDQTIEGNASEIHEVVIEGLEPETQYFYRVESKTASGTSYFSEPATFKTAVNKDTLLRLPSSVIHRVIPECPENWQN